MFPHPLQEIVTDESVKKPEPKTASMDVIETTTAHLTTMCSSGFLSEGKFSMIPASFEKDDDGNGHMDFITAASVRELQAFGWMRVYSV